MRAAWYERQGSASEVLTVGEMPSPAAGAGEVRIRMAASAGFEIAHRLALPDIAKAHELMEQPGRRGRVVLAI